MPARNDTWQDLIADIEAFLDEWYLAVSVNGFLYARPRSTCLSVEALERFLDRMRLICDDRFPDMIAIDLCDSSISKESWRQMRSRLGDFAAIINARFRGLSICREPVAIALIYRGKRGHADEFRKARTANAKPGNPHSRPS